MKSLLLLLSILALGLFPANAQFAARNHAFQYNLNNYDADAVAWIKAVEAADGSGLEPGVRAAMNQLVLDLKSNSLWTPIQTMTVKMGARTLAGALIDIKNPSTSWTNGNFVSADYNRTTGLIADDSTKYLNTNRNNNADGQNDQAMWSYVTVLPGTGSNNAIMGCGTNDNGTSRIVQPSGGSDVLFRSRNTTGFTSSSGAAVGLWGISRSASGSYTSRVGQTNTTRTQTSQTSLAGDIYEYAANAAGGSTLTLHSNHRSCAAAVGAAHDLAAAESCMATFIASITALGL